MSKIKGHSCKTAKSFMHNYKSPVYFVYNKNYNIPEKDGFSSTIDLNKGKKIHDQMVLEGLAGVNEFIDPGVISIEELSEVHTREYIDNLNQDPTLFFTLSGLEMLISPSVEELLKFFDPRPYFFSIVNGTKIAALIAWERKCTAINLGGGFHHAGIVCGKDMYGGYCVLADIPVAIYYLKKAYPDVQKVLIIDLTSIVGMETHSLLKMTIQSLHFLFIKINTFDQEQKRTI